MQRNKKKISGSFEPQVKKNNSCINPEASRIGDDTTLNIASNRAVSDCMPDVKTPVAITPCLKSSYSKDRKAPGDDIKSSHSKNRKAPEMSLSKEKQFMKTPTYQLKN